MRDDDNDNLTPSPLKTPSPSPFVNEIVCPAGSIVAIMGGITVRDVDVSWLSQKSMGGSGRLLRGMDGLSPVDGLLQLLR